MIFATRISQIICYMGKERENRIKINSSVQAIKKFPKWYEQTK